MESSLGAARLPAMSEKPSEAHDSFRLLVESSPEGTLLFRDLRLAFLNPAAARVFGASDPAQMLGMPLLELFHQDSQGAIQERVACALRGERVPPVEEKIVRLDGGVTDVEINAALLPGREGRELQLTVRAAELKRREALLRESEERLRLAFAGAQEGVWDWNVETGAVVYSPRWNQMLGYADDEIESRCQYVGAVAAPR